MRLNIGYSIALFFLTSVTSVLGQNAASFADQAYRVRQARQWREGYGRNPSTSDVRPQLDKLLGRAHPIYGRGLRRFNTIEEVNPQNPSLSGFAFVSNSCSDVPHFVTKGDKYLGRHRYYYRKTY